MQLMKSRTRFPRQILGNMFSVMLDRCSVNKLFNKQFDQYKKNILGTDHDTGMSDLDKYRTLVLDEMNIKMPLQYEPDRDRIAGFADCEHLGTTLDFGNEALVLMVTGIFSNWKQSVLYVIFKEATKTCLIYSLKSDCLQRLELAGLKVKLVICDQGPSNQSLFTNFLQVSASKPYFTINGNKVFVMWDPTNLFVGDM